MAAAAETLQIQEQSSRRTDDPIYNVRYLHEHMLDADRGHFDNRELGDVFEQNISDVGEADIHKYGVSVTQDYDTELSQYKSLEVGTVDNARTGRDAVDTSDPKNLFEYYRRDEE